MPYTHGTYGVLKDAVIPGADDSTTATVAVGVLPTHLVSNYADLVGVPLACYNANAKTDYGYCSDWGKYSLCEVMQDFLGSASGNLGGLYLINALDPAKHRASAKTTASVTFSNGVGYLSDTDAILGTIAVADVEDAEVAYDYSTERFQIRASVDDGAQSVEYYKVDASKVTAADVAAAVAYIDDIYPAYNAVPNLLIAPGWSDSQAVYDALCSKAQAVDGHFFAFVVADLDAGADTATADAAIEWKASHAYDSKFSKVCWPRMTDSDGKVHHISTLFAREMVRNDALNDGVPFVSADNTEVDGAKVTLADGTTQVRMYEEQGNVLNAAGISTAIAWAGGIYLWGGHTAGYVYGGDNEATAIFDTTMRMMAYVLNDFQTSQQPAIGDPMTVAMKDSILFEEQRKLDALAAQGALLGSPTVTFTSASNSLTTLANGEFTFDFSITPTVQAKTLRAIVAYSLDGLNSYLEEGDNA